MILNDRKMLLNLFSSLAILSRCRNLSSSTSVRGLAGYAADPKNKKRVYHAPEVK